MGSGPLPPSIAGVEQAQSPEPGPRLVICDDERLVAEGLRGTLEPEYSVAGIAASGAELMALLGTATADCVLLEVGLVNPSGLEVLKTIHALHPGLKVLVLTIYEDRLIADTCLHLGANGFMPKSATADELKEALRQVLRGDRYVSPRVPKSSHRSGLAAAHLAMRGLTPRDQEIMRLMGDGARPAEVAAELGISRVTVSLHLKQIRRRLGVHSARELVRYAVLVAASIENGTYGGQ